MPVSLEFIDGVHELEIGVSDPGDANRMFVYSGTAVFRSHGGGGSDWLRDSIAFDVGRSFSLNSIRGAVATAASGSFANASVSVDPGWAIDRAVADRNPDTGNIRLTLDYTVRDVDGHLLRAGYKVSVLACV